MGMDRHGWNTEIPASEENRKVSLCLLDQHGNTLIEKTKTKQYVQAKGVPPRPRLESMDSSIVQLARPVLRQTDSGYAALFTAFEFDEMTGLDRFFGDHRNPAKRLVDLGLHDGLSMSH
jgi:hypothetical protein